MKVMLLEIMVVLVVVPVEVPLVGLEILHQLRHLKEILAALPVMMAAILLEVEGHHNLDPHHLVLLAVLVAMDHLHQLLDFPHTMLVVVEVEETLQDLVVLVEEVLVELILLQDKLHRQEHKVLVVGVEELLVDLYLIHFFPVPVVLELLLFVM